MTCIVGVERDGKVYMGGDSAAVSDWDVQSVDSKKVFKIGRYLIGYTGSFRMGQILQYRLKLPRKYMKNDEEHIVSQFIPIVRKILKDEGYTKIEENREKIGGFMVGYNGKLYVINADLSATRFEDMFASVGCGQQYALGAIAAIGIRNPHLSIMTALEVAGKFCIGVRPPYYVLEG